MIQALKVARHDCEIIEKATEAEIAAAKPLEAVALQLCVQNWDSDHKFWCNHCSTITQMTKSQVKAHIRSRCVSVETPLIHV